MAQTALSNCRVLFRFSPLTMVARTVSFMFMLRRLAGVPANAQYSVKWKRRNKAGTSPIMPPSETTTVFFHDSTFFVDCTIEYAASDGCAKTEFKSLVLEVLQHHGSEFQIFATAEINVAKFLPPKRPCAIVLPLKVKTVKSSSTNLLDSALELVIYSNFDKGSLVLPKDIVLPAAESYVPSPLLRTTSTGSMLSSVPSMREMSPTLSPAPSSVGLVSSAPSSMSLLQKESYFTLIPQKVEQDGPKTTVSPTAVESGSSSPRNKAASIFSANYPSNFDEALVAMKEQEKRRVIESEFLLSELDGRDKVIKSSTQIISNLLRQTEELSKHVSVVAALATHRQSSQITESELNGLRMDASASQNLCIYLSILNSKYRHDNLYNDIVLKMSMAKSLSPLQRCPEFNGIDPRLLKEVQRISELLSAFSNEYLLTTSKVTKMETVMKSWESDITPKDRRQAAENAELRDRLKKAEKELETSNAQYKEHIDDLLKAEQYSSDEFIKQIDSLKRQLAAATDMTNDIMGEGGSAHKLNERVGTLRRENEALRHQLRTMESDKERLANMEAEAKIQSLIEQIQTRDRRIDILEKSLSATKQINGHPEKIAFESGNSITNHDIRARRRELLNKDKYFKPADSVSVKNSETSVKPSDIIFGGQHVSRGFDNSKNISKNQQNISVNPSSKASNRPSSSVSQVSSDNLHSSKDAMPVVLPIVKPTSHVSNGGVQTDAVSASDIVVTREDNASHKSTTITTLDGIIKCGRCWKDFKISENTSNCCSYHISSSTALQGHCKQCRKWTTMYACCSNCSVCGSGCMVGAHSPYKRPTWRQVIIKVKTFLRFGMECKTCSRLYIEALNHEQACYMTSSSGVKSFDRHKPLYYTLVSSSGAIHKVPC